MCPAAELELLAAIGIASTSVTSLAMEHYGHAAGSTSAPLMGALIAAVEVGALLCYVGLARSVREGYQQG